MEDCLTSLLIFIKFIYEDDNRDDDDISSENDLII